MEIGRKNAISIGCFCCEKQSLFCLIEIGGFGKRCILGKSFLALVFPTGLGRMKFYLKKIVLCLACFFFSLFFKLKPKKVFFRAYNGLRYACNPRAISEKLHELAPEYDIVWCFRTPEKIEDFPDYARFVKKGSFAELFEMFTSKICVLNAGIVLPCKRRGQFFLDTWHGDRAFKKVNLSADGKSSLVDAYRIIDVVLSGSDYADKVYDDAMKFKGEILHCGSPRNDIFFEDVTERVKCIRNKLQIENFDCVLTFAPTFRGVCSGVDDLDFSKLLDLLQEKTGKRWCALSRQHYKVKISDNWSKDPRIINASSYPEMQDILLVSDIVVSDYSSLVGDYVLLNRPVILYVPDLEEYKSGRGLYFDIEQSPFVYATNEEDLFKKVLDVPSMNVIQNCKDILDFYGHVCENGTASEQACKWIMSRA